MKTFDVQSIDFNVTQELAFAYIADPAQLPKWTEAFASVTGQKALMRTPNGEVEIGLVVHSSGQCGTIDWEMVFPDGSVAFAYSRVVKLSEHSCAYCFILTPPPVPLELLEGTLAAQSKILAIELAKLKGILEHG
ncbi:MAG: hypothetical protein WC782_15770 [Methylococcaceae bacterium]